MNNLVLVGFSCSGKSTIGRALSRRLRLRFVDTDKRIELVAGRTIPEIFRDEGEEAFRALERQVVAAVAADRFQVISTGGGAFVDPESRDQLLDDNLVVLLRVRPETVLVRLQRSRGGRPRPLLETPDPLQRIRELLEARQPAYAQAMAVVDVDNLPIHEATSQVVARWHAWRRLVRERLEAAKPGGMRSASATAARE